MNINNVLSMYSNLQEKGVRYVHDLYKSGQLSDTEVLVGKSYIKELGLDEESVRSFLIPTPIYKYKYRDLNGKIINKGELRFEEILKAIKLGLIFTEPVVNSYRSLRVYCIEKSKLNRCEFQVEEVMKELNLKNEEAFYEYLETYNVEIGGLKEIIKNEKEIDPKYFDDTLDLLNTLSSIYNRDWLIDLYEENLEYRFMMNCNCMEAYRLNCLLRRGTKL